jgi:DNA-binding CsgD family transcriptional regulator
VWSDRDDLNPFFFLLLSLLLLLIVVLGGIDLTLDASLRGPAHLILEVVFLILCLVSALYLGVGWLRTRRGLLRARSEGARSRAERDAWRDRTRKLLRGLGEAIDDQLRDWSLTGAERETALLILKGYSHKEIAGLTGRADRTVRQHAVAVYRKSGLAGRAELSAFFLEDLLLPLESASSAEASAPAD